MTNIALSNRLGSLAQEVAAEYPHVACTLLAMAGSLACRDNGCRDIATFAGYVAAFGRNSAIQESISYLNEEPPK